MAKTILEELKRFNSIRNYNYVLNEQEDPALEPDPALDPNAPVTPEAPVDPSLPQDATGELPMDVPPVDATEPTGMEGDIPMDDSTEEIDITDLVNMTKSLKKDVENSTVTTGENISKMDGVFSKLNDLEAKLGDMNAIIAKIDQLGSKVEEMRPKTPEERLEMRSLDSYPFSQTPQQFFDMKQNEMRRSGKNTYVLTKNDIDNYSKNQITQSFNPQYNQ